MVIVYVGNELIVWGVVGHKLKDSEVELSSALCLCFYGMCDRTLFNGP